MVREMRDREEKEGKRERRRIQKEKDRIKR